MGVQCSNDVPDSSDVACTCWCGKYSIPFQTIGRCSILIQRCYRRKLDCADPQPFRSIDSIIHTAYLSQCLGLVHFKTEGVNRAHYHTWCFPAYGDHSPSLWRDPGRGILRCCWVCLSMVDRHDHVGHCPGLGWQTERLGKGIYAPHHVRDGRNVEG